MLHEIDGDASDSELGAALSTLSLVSTTVFKVDSGADDHYVAPETKMLGVHPASKEVQTAAAGVTATVESAGTIGGTVQAEDGAVGVELEAQSGPAFGANLFSVRKAVQAGHTVVFSPDGSFLVGKDGTRVRLRDTRAGWELHVRQDDTTNTETGMAFDAGPSTITPEPRGGGGGE